MGDEGRPSKRLKKEPMFASDGKGLIVILENAQLETAKIGKNFDLLSSDKHASFLKKNGKDPSNYRPDITHQCLLMLLDSPLNRENLLRIYIHTARNVLIEINPQTRIPRTYDRFAGLMVELLHKLSIRAADSAQKLLRVIKNPVEVHLPVGCRKIGTSFNAKNVCTFKEIVPKSDEPLAVVLGAFARGKVNGIDGIQRKKSSGSCTTPKTMVQVEQFDILFSNPHGVFFAGQELSGTIILVLQDEKKVDEILLELKGKARTYWTKNSGKERKHCSDSEPYFCEQFNTEYTHAYGKWKERVLPIGRHEIPFSYQLPKNLPSSFEGEYGHIRFTCKATLERPWDYDVISKRAFTVVGIEDLNDEHKARDPIKLSDSSFTLQFCCRRQGTITVNLYLHKSGYAPGEKIPINAEVVNDSTKAIRYSCARIKQHTCYRAKTFAGQEHVKEVSRVIVSKEKGSVGPKDNFNWSGEFLQIPPVPPKLFRCRIIDISYTLEFEVDPGIVVMSPLIIGTIPLIESSDANSNQKPSTKKSSAAAEILGPSAIASGSATDRSTDDNSSFHSVEAVVVTVTDEAGQIVAEPCPLDLPTNEVVDKILPKLRVRLPSTILSELYPKLTSPVFEDSLFGKSNIFEEKETVHFGEGKFAPKYPMYKDVE